MMMLLMIAPGLSACVLGSRDWLFESLWEAILKPLGSSFEDYWASFGLLGGLLGLIGGLLRASWGLLGASWGFLEASWGGRLDCSVRGPSLGPFLGQSLAPLRPYWAPLGPSWGSLGPSWGPLGGLLGRLGAVLEASCAVLDDREAEKAKKPKSLKKTMEN